MDEEVYLLAGRQVQALFSLVTSLDPRDPDQICFLPPGYIKPLAHFPNSDWGNPQLLALEHRTKHWPCFVQISSAQGFFRALLRRSTNDEEGWFWALEWNQFLRVVGVLSLPDSFPTVFKDLPDPGWQPMPDGTGRFRRETALAPEDDTLFSDA